MSSVAVTVLYNGVRNKIFIAFSGLRKFAEIYEVFSMLIIAKDSALTYQTSTQEYVVFNVSGWIISMGRCNSLA